MATGPLHVTTETARQLRDLLRRHAHANERPDRSQQPVVRNGFWARIGSVGGGVFKDVETGAYSWTYLDLLENGGALPDTDVFPDAPPTFGSHENDFGRAFEMNGVLTVWRNSVVYLWHDGHGDLRFLDPNGGWFVAKITAKGTGGGAHAYPARRYGFEEQEADEKGLFSAVAGGLEGDVLLEGDTSIRSFDLNSFSGNIHNGSHPMYVWMHPGFFEFGKDDQTQKPTGKHVKREYIFSVEAPWVTDGEEKVL